MKLSDMLTGTEVLRVEGSLDIDIKGIHYDSRQVTPGSLFFCIEGYRADGHDFAVMAAEKGAGALVLRRDVQLPDGITKVFVENTRKAMGLISSSFYGNPSDNLILFGVTGTNGKTTTTYMIKSILEQAGKKTGLIGTITNMIGSRMIPTERTTPESPDLQRILAEMLKEDVEAAVMEVSSHSLELNRVTGCIYEVGIFTNLSRDHLDFHGTVDNYRASKAKLFEQSRLAVINVDDESGRLILDQLDRHSFTYGIYHPADIFARDIEIAADGVSFNLHILGGKIGINLRIPGIFSVYNALAAAASCYAAGISLGDIQAGLENIDGVPGRFELLDTGSDYRVILDYAHTPDGLENILRTARDLTKGRLVTLFGCGGDRDKAKRPLMGEVAGRYSDFCIITSDNPRSEEPMNIIRDILPGMKRSGCPYEVIADRRSAIEYALKHARKDDVIILAGKGHETYQEIKGKTIQFDEKKIVAEILGREKV
ncbi:MAG: UDP-N-acetylmuramoyl-L-alanyl-D-glutamate--2,6-diaminopimelate ligase [Caldicoprobacterales bacterium]|nr:UDP-N-acetylmuramoyl-L-alanyl-D-glutamate--2,6-diaminopimelate ligase [Clostridiales bacterium]